MNMRLILWSFDVTQRSYCYRRVQMRRQRNKNNVTCCCCFSAFLSFFFLLFANRMSYRGNGTSGPPARANGSSRFSALRPRRLPPRVRIVRVLQSPRKSRGVAVNTRRSCSPSEHRGGFSPPYLFNPPDPTRVEFITSAAEFMRRSFPEQAASQRGGCVKGAKGRKWQELVSGCRKVESG